jgi:hypothetical protein
MHEVINEACEREECRTVMALLTNREMKMVGGRPSDCARSAARDHAGKGCEEFVAEFVPAAVLFGGPR